MTVDQALEFKGIIQLRDASMDPAAVAEKCTAAGRYVVAVGLILSFKRLNRPELQVVFSALNRIEIG